MSDTCDITCYPRIAQLENDTETLAKELADTKIELIRAGKREKILEECVLSVKSLAENSFDKSANISILIEQCLKELKENK